MRTATGKEDPELPQLQGISSLELPGSEIAAQTNASQSSSNRHISTSTVQRKQGESGLHCQIAEKKPLLKDTNEKKRRVWAKKHKQWKYVLWTEESKWEIFGSLRCVCETQSRWTDDLRMCGSHCEAWRRWCDSVRVLCWSHCVIHFEFKAHLTSMATTAFCSDTPSHLVCS